MRKSTSNSRRREGASTKDGVLTVSLREGRDGGRKDSGGLLTIENWQLLMISVYGAEEEEETTDDLKLQWDVWVMLLFLDVGKLLGRAGLGCREGAPISNGLKDFQARAGEEGFPDSYTSEGTRPLRYSHVSDTQERDLA